MNVSTQRIGILFTICLLTICMLRADKVAAVEFLPRDTFRHESTEDREIVHVLDVCASTIPEFRRAWDQRLYIQDQFVVVLIEQDATGNRLPFALAVTQMDDESVTGFRIAETLPYAISGDKFSVDWQFVVDWRFREFLFMRGGELYKLLFSRLRENERRQIKEELPFGMNPPIWIRDFVAFIRSASNEKFLKEFDKSQEFELFVMQPMEARVADSRMTISEFNCVFGNRDTTRKLVELGFYENIANPLIYCSYSGNTESAAELIALFDINFRCPDVGLTPLICAANSGQYKLVEFFLRNGSDPNVRTFDKKNALFFCHTPEMISLLTKFGAEVNAVDSSGLTVLDRFRQDGNKLLADAVERHAGRPSGTGFLFEPEKLLDYRVECGGILPVRSFPRITN